MNRRTALLRLGLLAILGLGVLWTVSRSTSDVAAAPNAQVTPTPAQIELPTAGPTVALTATDTPTRTPTPVGPALAEALDEGGSNVRAAPDIESERLGVIYPGEFFPVIGRASGTLWLKIQYPDSPSGTAWVFEQVVALTGDVDAIPELDIFSEPTIDAGAVVSTQTIEALAQTPGALQTATALGGPTGVAFGANGTPAPGQTAGPLPTFTFPPAGAAAQATTFFPASGTNPADSGELPPIIPIIALGALGGLGLLVGLLRRLG